MIGKISQRGFLLKFWVMVPDEYLYALLISKYQSNVKQISYSFRNSDLLNEG